MKAKEIKAILGTFIFTLLIVGLYYLIRVVLAIKGDDISFTALVVLPILVYLILGDKLKGFKAGAFEATFRDMANAKVSMDKQEAVASASEEVGIVRKGSPRQLRMQLSRLQNLDENKKLIYTMHGGMRDFYDLAVLQEYVYALASIPNFKFVVILGQNNQVVRYARLTEFAMMLENEEMARDFIAVLEAGDYPKFEKFPSFLSKTISPNTKNMEALKTMDELNLDQLIVVDEHKKLMGMVEREKILTKLVIALSNV